MRSTELAPVLEFLRCATPDAWVEAALAQQELLLIDHANCEKKAASTALNLMFRYSGDVDFLASLSRLAREELRHFEQVLKLMRARGIAYRRIDAARYAQGLRELVRTHEPARLVDTLIAGAFIEARSCERFARLAPHLDAELAHFYRSLLRSESRHFRDYLAAARKAADGADIAPRIELFAERERQLIEAEDTQFRFHSGPPAAGAAYPDTVGA
ncbi:MAG: tRNA-(ms[2]io[6]A)-hydroxylase [Pseudomonadales bacterium]|jgi:tRNA-(ms[2]io[6]A)-hydroxylase|nr:tRNA-(ms[2]io[6]A)-hydroxylase [Pseudomonadales bacterium]MBP9034377.1 tRNA-(ms[2]io[6]A)-hydroxylase [Pseudomonadales bacterium]